MQLHGGAYKPNFKVYKFFLRNIQISTSHKVQLEGLLRKAANALYLNDEFTEAQKHNYFMSVTEREVYKGCINAKNVKVSPSFYLITLL